MSTPPQKNNENRNTHTTKMRSGRPTSGRQNQNTTVKGDTRTAAQRRATGRNGHQNKTP